MPRTYLVRYGLERRTTWFTAEDPALTPDLGSDVVIRTRRGLELGRVMLQAERDGQDDRESGTSGRLLRIAGTDDLEMAAALEAERTGRFDACRAVLTEGVWPIELVDAEPLLDGRRTVLHYLGPHHLEAEGLRDALRDRCGLDVWLEAVGADVAPDEGENAADPEEANGCGSCGTGGGCGSSGSSGGCGTGGGCGSCGVKDLIASRGRRPGRDG